MPDQDRDIETRAGWPTGHEMIVQLREALGLFSGAMPISPQQAWEEALAEVRQLTRHPAAARERAARCRPTVVCLCGSTRFREAFERVACDETLAGRIVLTVNDFDTVRRQPVGHHPPPAEKAKVDELHLRKIDLADEVLVLNVGGYIGESTRRELAYARRQGKRVRFLEEDANAV